MPLISLASHISKILAFLQCIYSTLIIWRNLPIRKWYTCLCIIRLFVATVLYYATTISQWVLDQERKTYCKVMLFSSSFSLAVLTQSKDLKNEMSSLVDKFLANIEKKAKLLSKKHHKERIYLMRAKRQRDQVTNGVVNKYYDALSLDDIRHEWKPHPMSIKDMASALRRNSYNPPQAEWASSAVPVKSVASSICSPKSYNPPLSSSTESTDHSSSNDTTPRKSSLLPLPRKSEFDQPASPATLEPEVRVIDETTLWTLGYNNDLLLQTCSSGKLRDASVICWCHVKWQRMIRLVLATLT